MIKNVRIGILILILSGCTLGKNLAIEEPKIGLISKEELCNYKWFKKSYKKYHFNNLYKDSLSAIHRYRIVIIGGDWCSDTRQFLPNFIKILDKVEFDKNKLSIVLVDRSKKIPVTLDFVKDSISISYIPTFILLDEYGNEKGRIIESPTLSLESDLIKILNLP